MNIKINSQYFLCGFTNYFHFEKITAYYEKSHTIEKKSQMSQNEPKMPIPVLKNVIFQRLGVDLRGKRTID
jgi:hypothetical protein